MRYISLISAITLSFLTFTSMAEEQVAPKEADIISDRAPLTYTGWVALKRQKIDPAADEDDWVYVKKVESSDEGEIIKILDDGKETGYAFQLIVITYEKTNTTVLKLGLIDEATGKTITYIWGEPGAERLGMNLRWVQIGLTKAAS